MLFIVLVMETKAHFDNAWVAIQTRILYEKVAAEHLVIHGYECFLPLHCKRTHRTVPAHQNDKQYPNAPLFPGYLFCRYKVQHKFPILRVPGVIRILGCNGVPAVIPDQEIVSLQKIVISGIYAEPYQFLKTGQKVRVNHGPLRDTEGYLIQVNKNTCKIAAGISVVEKSVVITVATTDVCMI